jgi:hypothetical protein
MTVPHEPTPSSPSPSPWLSEAPVRVSELVQSLRAMAESLARDTMVPQLVYPTAPTRQLSHVSVRFMLKPMPSHMPPGMAYLWQIANYTAPTRPAIRAHVYSLMREYQPWFSFVSIETTLV